MLLVSSLALGQINTFYVTPNATDSGYAIGQDSHMVVRNSTTNNDHLFLFLGGTGSTTKSYKRISEFAGDLGFDVINLAYSNDVAAASLKNSSDLLAFDNYRQEICHGTQLSSAVTVDSFNSITTRFVKLLEYLQLTFPAESWDQYLFGGELDWSKISVGGHSQGSGHAAYFAKSHLVDRVLMFSGPNDYSEFFDSPANWLTESGTTPSENHFAYQSLLDEVVDFEHQFSNIEALGLYPLYDTVHVDKVSSPFNQSQCLYTTQNPGLVLLHHNVPIKFSSLNNTVWEYMLTNPIAIGVESNSESDFLVFPNPVASILNVSTEAMQNNHSIVLHDLYGRQILNDFSGGNQFTIDLSALPVGVYILQIDEQVIEVFKK